MFETLKAWAPLIKLIPLLLLTLVMFAAACSLGIVVASQVLSGWPMWICGIVLGWIGYRIVWSVIGSENW